MTFIVDRDNNAAQCHQANQKIVSRQSDAWHCCRVWKLEPLVAPSNRGVFFWHSMYPGWGGASAARSKCWSGNDWNASTRTCAPHYHLLEKWIHCCWWSTLAAWWLYQCSFSRCMCLDILLLFPLDFSMDLTLHSYYFLTTSACVCTHIEHQQAECPHELKPADRSTPVHMNLVRKEEDWQVGIFTWLYNYLWTEKCANATSI
jgi:hypothetical protein